MRKQIENNTIVSGLQKQNREMAAKFNEQIGLLKAKQENQFADMRQKMESAEAKYKDCEKKVLKSAVNKKEIDFKLAKANHLCEVRLEWLHKYEDKIEADWKEKKKANIRVQQAIADNNPDLQFNGVVVGFMPTHLCRYAGFFTRFIL